MGGNDARCRPLNLLALPFCFAARDTMTVGPLRRCSAKRPPLRRTIDGRPGRRLLYSPQLKGVLEQPASFFRLRGQDWPREGFAGASLMSLGAPMPRAGRGVPDTHAGVAERGAATPRAAAKGHCTRRRNPSNQESIAVIPGGAA